MEIEKVFALRVKEIRKTNGLTQKGLADKLGYTEKAIAKWESGKAIPSVETLAKISKTFNVSVDSLIIDKSVIYYLGVDGGGTETKLALADSSGQIIKREIVSASNPIDLGYKEAAETIISGVRKITGGINLRHICAFFGIAGYFSYKEKDKFTDLIKTTLNFKAAYFGNDIDNVLAAGLKDEDGSAVIMGTGFCIIERKGEEKTLKSGWGYLIDEGGSGFNIGRNALSAYFSYLDGNTDKSILFKLITKRAGLEGRDLCSEIYKQGKKYVASFSKDVITAALKGDKLSLNIIETNIDTVVDILTKSIKNKAAKIVFSGGLVSQPIVHKDLFKKLKDKGFKNISLICSPLSDGAIANAMRLYGKEKHND